MKFWIAMGVLAGGVLGGIADGFGMAIVGAIVGAALGVVVGRRATAAKAPVASTASSDSLPPPRPDYGRDSTTAAALQPPTVAHADLADVVARLEGVERRLAAIESRLGMITPAADRPTDERALAAAPTPSRTIVLPTLSPAIDGTMQVPAREAEAVASSAVAETAAPDSDTTPPPRPAYGATVSTPGQPAQPSALWRWITGGNAMTRVGIIVLFFGVAFLLRYFAEIVTVPIELKLAGAGALGLAIAAIGFVLARKRPAYGLSLQGAGLGIVYLTVFAAFRLYEVMGPLPAIALLVVVSAAMIVLALRSDSQPLAALALAGGFLAPVLIRTGSSNVALLFGYFAVLNAVIFALAWRRAWRPLNVLGFVFTFALALAWGHRFYTPAHYAIVQPYLALFFAFYVTIAILYARRSALNVRAPVDGLLVFGVPIVGFALQIAIVRAHHYGVAWSAGLLAVLYGVLWFMLRRSASEGLALLARAFALLAVIFATLVVPFTVDPRPTAAWWAIEAAAVYWLGAAQRQPVMRVFALVLQVLAALVFFIDYAPGEGRLFLNANFLGMALLGLAAFGSAWVADRHPDVLGPREQAIVPALILWGIGWWLIAGIDDLRHHVEGPGRNDAILAWVAASSGVALAIARWLPWPRIAWMAAALFPSMVAVGMADVRAARTTLTHYGWLVWPLAMLVHWCALRYAERLRETTATRQPVRDDMFRLAHGASGIALIAWLSWELSEWAGRYTSVTSIWLACAAALAPILYLYATVKMSASQRWPFASHAAAYGATAGTTIAAALFAWLVIVTLTTRGDPDPLPYVPLLNPLDLTAIAAIGALAAWDGAWGRHSPTTRYGWLGAAAFIALNGAVIRTAHHWGDVRWRFDALLAYRPLQAALTLTWTVTALAIMLYATRRGVRALWTVGAVLLAAVVVKLFVADLAALSGLTRVIAFMGVGALLLVIGYVAPLPPAAATSTEASSSNG